MAIYGPPIYARCLPRRSLPRGSHFFPFLFFFEGRPSPLYSCSLLSKLASFLQREIDCSSCMLPLRSSGQDDWPGAIAIGWRLRKGWNSLKSGLFPVPTFDEQITKHWLSFKQAEKKKQLFKAMLGQESASEKYRKQCFLHDRTAGMPRTSCLGRNNTISLLGQVLV